MSTIVCDFGGNQIEFNRKEDFIDKALAGTRTTESFEDNNDKQFNNDNIIIITTKCTKCSTTAHRAAQPAYRQLISSAEKFIIFIGIIFHIHWCYENFTVSQQRFAQGFAKRIC